TSSGGQRAHWRGCSSGWLWVSPKRLRSCGKPPDMFVAVEGQAPALMSVHQRRLAMLVMAALLVLSLWLLEPRPVQLLHAAAMGGLTLLLIVLSVFEEIGRPTLRISAMAAATMGLVLLTQTNPESTPAAPSH